MTSFKIPTSTQLDTLNNSIKNEGIHNKEVPILPVKVERVTNTLNYVFAQSGTETAGYRYGISSSKIQRRQFDETGELGYEQVVFTPPDGWALQPHSWCYRFPNGRIMCICRNATTQKSGIFVSDLNESDTDKTFEMKQECEAHPYSKWGKAVYGDMVFIAEYEGYTTIKGDASSGRYVYMTRDQGLTWTTILDREAVCTQGNATLHTMHFHNVNYDPWAGMVWVVCGDVSWSNVLYSYDFGLNWHELFEGGISGYDFIQFLGVGATPEYVMLGTDWTPNGIYAMRKPSPLSRNGGEFTPDMLEMRYIDEQTAQGIQGLFHNFICEDGYYFAASTNTTGRINPVLLASPNGYDWYEIYRHERLVTRNAGGFMNFYRMGDNLYARMYDDSGYHNKLYKIALPKWRTI